MSVYAEADVAFVGLLPLHSDILTAVGQTPLVRLERFFPENRVRLYARSEMPDPRGGVKDRAALGVLLDGYSN